MRFETTQDIELQTKSAVVGLISSVVILGIVVACFFFLVVTVDGKSRGGQQDVRPTKIIRLGKIPSVTSREAHRKYDKLLRKLAKYLGVDRVELVLAPDYDTCVKYLREKVIDLAWLGTYAYVAWRDKIAMEPLVRPLWSGRPSYRGVIFTVEDSGIQTLQQLKGKRIAFVDKRSASGYLYAKAVLERAGLRVPDDFAAVDFLGNHDAVLMAVLVGEYDAGAVYDKAYESVAYRSKRTKLRILAETDPIPGEPIVVLSSTPQRVKEWYINAFLALNREDLTTDALKDLFGFERAYASDYDQVARLLEK